MLIAGPCAIESREQALKIAEFVKSCGATHFRGGLWKGQNRPIVNGKPEYVGMGQEGIGILTEIRDKLDMPCVCDAQTIQQAQLLNIHNIGYVMVGARNMDNLALLRELKGEFDTFRKNGQIILKRSPSATVNEWVGAAEHLGGAERVILCERGTVHFDRHDFTRYRLDFVGVAELKKYYPEYKVIIDPSHGSGDKELVYLLSKAALAIADGLMVEVHYDPDSSTTDSPQIINFDEFKKLAELYNG